MKDNQSTAVAVDMQNFDVDETLEELTRQRFSMPPVVIAAFRQAASKGAARLLNLVSDDERFEKLTTKDQLRVLELIFDRAYGKSETASTSAMTEAKIGGGPTSDHSKQLEAIEQRALERRKSRRLSNSNAAELDKDFAGFEQGDGSLYPEFSKSSKRATRNSPVTAGSGDANVVPLTREGTRQ